MNKVFLLDAYALIYRAYYAFIRTPRITSKGQNVSAILGFVNILNEIIRKESPDNICVVFDPPGGSFRRVMYPDYKANRESTPEDIRLSVPIIKEILEALNIVHTMVTDYEADDVIGTLAKRFSDSDNKIYMVTPDKDYCQLITEDIYMYKHVKGGKHEIITPKEVCEKYNISETSQIIDILALWGDAADNVPGATGVGEKTASKLIAEYGSVEGILANTDKLKGKQKINIENSKQNIELSKDLVTIRIDVETELSLEDIKFKTGNIEKLKKLYKELEFSSLYNKLQPPKPKVVQQTLFGGLFDTPTEEVKIEESIDISKHNISKIDIDNCASLCDKIKSNKVILDTEKGKNSHILSLAIDTEVYYIQYYSSEENIIIKEILNSLKSSEVSVFNLKEFIKLLNSFNIEYSAKAFDIELAHYVLMPEQKHSRRKICSDYAGFSEYGDIFEDLAIHQSFDSLDETNKEKIIKQRIIILSKTVEKLSEELKNNNQEELYYNIELPLVEVLSYMEKEGVRLDLATISELTEENTIELKNIEKKIFDIVGHDFNLSSPKQLGLILFDELDIEPKPKKTKTGQYATGEEVLIKLKDKYEIIDFILQHRSLKKIISTYLEALPKLINAQSGKIHTTFNQTSVSTGRLSSSNPNLQNIPIKSEKGRKIRGVFIPEDNQLFVSVDYSQVELRLMAHFCKDEHMLSAFKNKEDIHTATASKIFGVEKNDVTKEMRFQAKTANFAIIYGVSAFGLSQSLNIPRKEAKELIDNYFMQYPNIRTFIDETIEKTKELGYVETLFGRRRYLSDINSSNSVVRSYAERNAVNSPIQGTAADIIKIAMNLIYTEIKSRGLKTRMLFQVHDELNFSVPVDELDEVKEIIVDKMERSTILSVPLDVEIGVGANWNEAH